MSISDFDEAVENCDDLSSYNHSELYQLCRQAGVPCSPDMPRGTLMALLDGEITIDVENTMDELRDALMQFLLQHWRRVQAQLTCPAKSGDPKSCYQCVDAQVTHCIQTNHVERQVHELVERKKKNDRS